LHNFLPDLELFSRSSEVAASIKRKPTGFPMPAASPHLAGCPRMASASSLSLATAVSLTSAATALQEEHKQKSAAQVLKLF
jgi:hypothetical protein